MSNPDQLDYYGFDEDGSNPTDRSYESLTPPSRRAQYAAVRIGYQVRENRRKRGWCVECGFQSGHSRHCATEGIEG